MSKRSSLQCRKAAMNGKSVCRTHGGASTGPKTIAGRRSNDDAKPDAIRKSFNRARGKLQEYDYIREYENKIWCIDEPDRQDK